MTSKKAKPAAPAKSGKKAQAATTTKGQLPPYGVPIREAMARGDVREMRRVAASARKWVSDTQAALDAMEKALKDLEG